MITTGRRSRMGGREAAVVALALLAWVVAAGAARAEPAFAAFLESLWPAASARSVTRAVFDDAFRGLTPDPKVVSLSKAQSEFSRPIWTYVEGAISPARIARGRELARTWGPVLDRIERASGVPRAVVLAFWALETSFGTQTGGFDTVRSLATLAFIRYRGAYYRDELLAALEMLERDHIQRDAMRGSWAGAMGQTQFMPSTFLAYAADGDGDGRRDIWTSTPDALASIARFLQAQGWQAGVPWGFEIALPAGFDFRHSREPFATWSGLSIRRLDGQPLPRTGAGVLFLPSGIRGPAFLVGDNWEVIRSYNTSDSYALAIGSLADQIAGGQPIQAAWPKGDRMLDARERLLVQTRLKALGFYEEEPDGRFGAKTRDAVRRFQLARGILADGYADETLLRALAAR